MPFIPSSSPQIQIFRDVLNASVKFVHSEPSTDGASAMQHTEDSNAILTANTLARTAYSLFAKNNYQIEFDGQPVHATEYVANPAKDAPRDVADHVTSDGQRELERGRSLLDHLASSLASMYSNAGVSPDKEEHASTVAALLATPEFWNAEADAMAGTLNRTGFRLDPKPSSTTIRVWKLADGTGWGMHKVMHWHAYTDSKTNKVRHMDDGGPILTVDKTIEISFDAVESQGDHPTKYCGEARTTLCHVGWADPRLDVLTAKTDPDSGAALKHSPLEQFAYWLFSIVADTFGMQGIRYTALTSAALDKIIEDRPTIRSHHPTNPRRASASTAAAGQCIAVKRQPSKERHYAARNLHDALNGTVWIELKPDNKVVQTSEGSTTERPSMVTMLCMARNGNLALNGIVRASADTALASAPGSSRGVASKRYSKKPLKVDGVNHRRNSESESDGEDDFPTGSSSHKSRVGSGQETLDWLPSNRSRSATLQQTGSEPALDSDGMSHDASIYPEAINAVPPDKVDEPPVQPNSLFTPQLTDEERSRLTGSPWQTLFDPSPSR